MPHDAKDRHDDPSAANSTDFGALAEQAMERALSRRTLLGAAATFGASAFVLGAGGFLSTTRAKTGAAPHWLRFNPVAANRLDTITLPKGFRWRPVISWGDPLWSKGSAFDHKTRGDAASQALAFGDNNDGMSVFTVNGRTILAVNNEYVNKGVFFGNRDSQTPETEDDILKGKHAHGVSILEIKQENGHWKPVLDSEYNRKITPDTPMDITGPARGHTLLKTDADPQGVQALGTWNNCGNGETPWGTYLSCEENFHGYFGSDDAAFQPSKELQRYGVKTNDKGYAWRKQDERFDIAKHPNEPNRAGYVVEIDPLDPTAAPKKRTALGRFKHENAEVTVAANGHVVVYLGDDERGEYLYRFVSADKHNPKGDNRNLLEDGQLYAAKFNDDGSGVWLPLTPETTGMDSKAEICIHTRQAASAVRATTMDRPEWIAAHPHKTEAYCCLTNNKNRGKKPNAGGDATPVGGPNPRKANPYGQIVRWTPDHGDHTADTFRWALFVLAGNPIVHRDAHAGSDNVTPNNTFNSPDGLKFDSKGGLWIQTDGKYTDEGHFAGQGNNQMLLGNTETGRIDRFLVGPRQCEVTGICWSADRKTIFIGIQHPGEGQGDSHFPGGGETVPRSSVIAITRDDGGEMG